MACQWFVRFVLPKIAPEVTMYAFLGGVGGGGLAVLVWWLFFSRARWSERLGALVLMPAAVFGTWFLVHPSIAHGAMGMMLPMFAIPALCLALVCWALVVRVLPAMPRLPTLAASILLACAVFTALRTGGLSGEGESDLHWRWTKTPEERMLAQERDEPMAAAAASTAADTAPVWPGFRGPGRDGVVRGIQIATDWSHSPPVELWRRAVGPAWSSFAVQGERIYTQEQRGEDEVVAC